ncbi:MAG: hypothetical protein J5850_02975 [Clostridia bacterium]|nr:hypothetical protein [Clostridia bacterium]
MERTEIEAIQKELHEIMVRFLKRCAEIMLTGDKGDDLARILYEDLEKIPGDKGSGGFFLLTTLEAHPTESIAIDAVADYLRDFSFLKELVSRNVEAHIGTIKEDYDRRWEMINDLTIRRSKVNTAAEREDLDKIEAELRAKYGFSYSTTDENPDREANSGKEAETIPQNTPETESTSEPKPGSDASSGTPAPDIDEKKRDLMEQIDDRIAEIKRFFRDLGLSEEKKDKGDGKLVEFRKSILTYIDKGLSEKREENDSGENGSVVQGEGEARIENTSKSITDGIALDAQGRNAVIHKKTKERMAEAELGQRIKNFCDHIEKWGIVFKYASATSKQVNDIDIYYTEALNLFYKLSGSQPFFVVFEAKDYYDLNSLIDAMCEKWDSGLDLLKADHSIRELIEKRYETLLPKYKLIQSMLKAVFARESRMRIKEIIEVSNFVKELEYDLRGDLYADMYDACMFKFIYELNPAETFFCWKKPYRPAEFADEFIVPLIRDRSTDVARRTIRRSEVHVLAEYRLFSFFFRHRNLTEGKKVNVLKIRGIEEDVLSFCKGGDKAPKLYEVYAQLWRLADEMGSACNYTVKEIASQRQEALVPQGDCIDYLVGRVEKLIESGDVESAYDLIEANSFADFRGWLWFKYRDKKNKDAFFERYLTLKARSRLFSDPSDDGSAAGRQFFFILPKHGESALDTKLIFKAEEHYAIRTSMRPGIGLIPNSASEIRVDADYIRSIAFFCSESVRSMPISDIGIKCDVCEKFVSMMTDGGSHDLVVKADRVRKLLTEQFAFVYPDPDIKNACSVLNSDGVIDSGAVLPETFDKRKIICRRDDPMREELFELYEGIARWGDISTGTERKEYVKAGDVPEDDVRTDYGRMLEDLAVIYGRYPDNIDGSQFVLKQYYGIICSSLFRAYTASKVAESMFKELKEKAEKLPENGSLRRLKKTLRSLASIREHASTLFDEFKEKFYLFTLFSWNTVRYGKIELREHLESATKDYIEWLNAGLNASIEAKSVRITKKRKRRITLIVIALILAAVAAGWLLLQKVNGRF